MNSAVWQGSFFCKMEKRGILGERKNVFGFLFFRKCVVFQILKEKR